MKNFGDSHIQKQHFGVWKYFVHKTSGEKKAKYFITDDCYRVPSEAGLVVQQKQDMTEEGREKII